MRSPERTGDRGVKERQNEKKGKTLFSSSKLLPRALHSYNIFSSFSGTQREKRGPGWLSVGAKRGPLYNSVNNRCSLSLSVVSLPLERNRMDSFVLEAAQCSSGSKQFK